MSSMQWVLKATTATLKASLLFPGPFPSLSPPRRPQTAGEGRGGSISCPAGWSAQSRLVEGHRSGSGKIQEAAPSGPGAALLHGWGRPAPRDHWERGSGSYLAVQMEL